jgi:isoleucyl-tRNA synthetase
VNVKEVVLERELAAYGTIELVVNSRVIGKRMGNAMKAVLAASKEGRWQDNGDGTVQVADQTLGEGDFTLRLRLKEGSAGHSLSKQGAVLLDVSVTPELEREGLARDLMRVIQQTRKQAGLGISDRIRLRLKLPTDFHPAVEAHRELIQEETLAADLALGDAEAADYQAGHDVHGQKVYVGVSKVG